MGFDRHADFCGIDEVDISESEDPFDVFGSTSGSALFVLLHGSPPFPSNQGKLSGNCYAQYFSQVS